MNIAIIPARGGSKRIPRKNIKHFLGKPIIAYPIEAALKSGVFEKVIVSTDDEEISDIACALGASVPFLRSKENSNDFASTADVLTEVLEKILSQGHHFSNCCCIYPTAPFLSPTMILNALKVLVNKNYKTVFPVLRYSFPIWRSLKIENEKVALNWPEYLTSRSQDLPVAYHDAGQFYWFRIKEFLENKVLYTDNSGCIEVSELEAQDIDNDIDWKLAELKYQLLNTAKK